MHLDIKRGAGGASLTSAGERERGREGEGESGNSLMQ